MQKSNYIVLVTESFLLYVYALLNTDINTTIVGFLLINIIDQIFYIRKNRL